VIKRQQAVTANPLGDVVSELLKMRENEPGNRHIPTYTAELLLWQGEYERALELFRDSRERFTNRWSFIGEGAALRFLGKEEEAFQAWDAFTGVHLPYAATYCYRGEIWLNRGEPDRAGELLHHAAKLTPARLGAWPALGVLAHRTGDEELARSAGTSIERLCPALAHFAAPGGSAAVGFSEEEFAKMLRSMRGNRSSHIYSFFDSEGRFRCHLTSLSRQVSRIEEAIEQLWHEIPG
jgi:tetratricopeptide (TPR) repeat protein